MPEGGRSLDLDAIHVLEGSTFMISDRRGDVPLLAAPILALTDQAISYATVGWACDHQHAIAVHAVHIFFLLAAAAGTAPAWQLWSETSIGRAGNEAVARRHFLAGLAVALSALSVLVIASMWMPTWIIAPCSD